MSPKHYEVNIDLYSIEPTRSILISILEGEGFNGFCETDNGLVAYISSDILNEKRLIALINTLKNNESIKDIRYGTIQDKNWNEKWESEFKPITIGNELRVRASFHSTAPLFKKEIVIDPKMAFGTGHHETTEMMLSYILNLNMKDKKVLDVGCGTGILCIMSEIEGAKDIMGIDNDPKAVENCRENIGINGGKKIQTMEGEVSDLGKRNSYDVIFANINKNILLEDIPDYAIRLNSKAKLAISGFFDEDERELREKADENGLEFVSKKDKNKWAMLEFENHE